MRHLVQYTRCLRAASKTRVPGVNYATPCGRRQQRCSDASACLEGVSPTTAYVLYCVCYYGHSHTYRGQGLLRHTFHHIPHKHSTAVESSNFDCWVSVPHLENDKQGLLCVERRAGLANNTRERTTTEILHGRAQYAPRPATGDHSTTLVLIGRLVYMHMATNRETNTAVHLARFKTHAEKCGSGILPQHDFKVGSHRTAYLQHSPANSRIKQRSIHSLIFFKQRLEQSGYQVRAHSTPACIQRLGPGVVHEQNRFTFDSGTPGSVVQIF